ncbi:phospholipase D-like domain-containing protein [Sedimenticola sp.]|uniref:phospholipase D-like domain-containing protein n=1 Tax=Sedimenticola sp. TaxID=1940285 RepID=UPI003D11BAEC
MSILQRLNQHLQDLNPDRLIAQWGEVAWSEAEYAEALETISLIGQRLVGTILADQEIIQPLVAFYVCAQVDRYLNQWARRYRSSLQPSDDSDRRAVATVKGDTQLPFLKPSAYVDRIDLNYASQKTLESLPGVGPQLALRIIEDRPFQSSRDVQRIHGIGPAKAKLLNYLTTVNLAPDVSSLSQAMDRFSGAPSFTNLVSLLRTREGSSMSLTLLAELRDALIHLAPPHSGTSLCAHHTRMSDITRWNEQRKGLSSHLATSASTAINTGALLYDGGYLPFVEKLVAEARESVYILMFFMRYVGSGHYPTDKLVDALAQAKHRGVDVRVILDVDDVDGVAQSRFINEAAYEQFRELGIPVLYDTKGRKTHSKFLVVDNRHLVLGSHNWTAGSFYAYDDTSIYLDSAETVAIYRDSFLGLWHQFDDRHVQPKIQRVKCVEPTEAGGETVYRDCESGVLMDRAQFCEAIQRGSYPDYYVRRYRGKLVPATKPNQLRFDNLR